MRLPPLFTSLRLNGPGRLLVCFLQGFIPSHQPPCAQGPAVTMEAGAYFSACPRPLWCGSRIDYGPPSRVLVDLCYRGVEIPQDPGLCRPHDLWTPRTRALWPTPARSARAVCRNWDSRARARALAPPTLSSIRARGVLESSSSSPRAWAAGSSKRPPHPARRSRTRYPPLLSAPGWVERASS